jgi:putative cardiolipin synthase
MRARAAVIAALLVAGLAAGGCASLPPLEPRTVSHAVRDTAETRLGRAVGPLVAAHPGQSGIVPLAFGMDAFTARAVLASQAERSLDVQYYIWHGDVSGTLLFEALQRAAERGVRVRLLLDDNNTVGFDDVLAALDAHAALEVRLFNPFVHRKVRAAGYATDFRRLNRRMHNKSFTADNQVTIVGGRNVGDEYFAGGEELVFADLDVIAIGPVVEEVSSEFDRYWSSASSYPAERVLPAAPPDAAAKFAADAARLREGAAALPYVEALASSDLEGRLGAGALPFEWARTQLVCDDPAKALKKAHRDKLILARIGATMGLPQREFDVVSPYFVPRKPGTKALREMVERGVRVRVLTNAFEATDVPAVHAGYAKRREPLLEGGVQLFELKRTAGASGGAVDRGLTGSSGASLHAKTFAIDRSRVFVGSFNFDPRSAVLNTEMGLVIDSPLLAEHISQAFETVIPANSYEVRRTRTGTLEWLERRGAEEIVHKGEPGATVLRRFLLWIMSILPIEGLL